MKYSIITTLSVISLSLTACDGSKPSPGVDGVDAGQDARVDLSDGLINATDARPDQGMMSEDQGPVNDAQRDSAMTPDAATDMGIAPVDVTNCSEACARYESCGRLDDVFGTNEDCLRSCQRVERDGAPTAWFECIGQEQCNLLHLCPVPAPVALPCEAVCEHLHTCAVTTLQTRPSGMVWSSSYEHFYI